MTTIKVTILIDPTTQADLDYARQIDNDLRALFEQAKLPVRFIKVEHGE